MPRKCALKRPRCSGVASQLQFPELTRMRALAMHHVGDNETSTTPTCEAEKYWREKMKPWIAPRLAEGL